jgi:formylglycine-generating enzyme required for sulfatase activity
MGVNEYWLQRNIFVLALLAMIGYCMGNTALAQTTPQKIAFIVGVSQYQKHGLEDLQFAHKDASDLAAELEKHDFQVTSLIGDQATYAEFTRSFQAFVRQAAQLNKSDVVLFSFAGHGLQQQIHVGEGAARVLVETPFLCVADTRVGDPESMINLNWVLDELKTKSGSRNNLVVIDACRNNPNQAARSFDGSTVRELPNNLSILFSSSSGQCSYESKVLQQGIFTHVLLEGLRGAAKNSRDEINWLKLVGHVMSEVPIQAESLVDDPRLIQKPNSISNLTGTPILAKFGTKDARATSPMAPPDPASPARLTVPFDATTAARGQADWAKHLKLEVRSPNSVGMEMVLIPPGEFMMGSERVTLTNAFLMASTEVTQGQWKAVMGTEPWQGKGSVRIDADYPATYLSWADAAEFCRRLSERDGRKYRLPTEAEWEYACRGGSRTQYSFGGNPADLDGHGWFSANADHMNERYAHRVGQKRPNPFGLYDMHGNVWEWCSDWYGDYASGSQTNPTGSESGEYRVCRGGSWRYGPGSCRSADRGWYSPPSRDNNLGFRPVSVLVE